MQENMLINKKIAIRKEYNETKRCITNTIKYKIVKVKIQENSFDAKF